MAIFTLKSGRQVDLRELTYGDNCVAGRLSNDNVQNHTNVLIFMSIRQYQVKDEDGNFTEMAFAPTVDKILSFDHITRFFNEFTLAEGLEIGKLFGELNNDLLPTTPEEVDEVVSNVISEKKFKTNKQK